MKYVASRMSKGNKLFPAEIITESNAITIRIPGVFNSDTTTIAFGSISAVEIDTPLIGFSTIRFYHSGNKVEVHGFSKSDVNEIKDFIENGRNNSAATRV